MYLIVGSGVGIEEYGYRNVSNSGSSTLMLGYRYHSACNSGAQVLE